MIARALALVAAIASTAQAEPGVQEEPSRPTPFDRGRFWVSAGAGRTSAFGERYFAIGAGGSYFVLDGLAAGLSSQVQWGNGPTITGVTPELRYVAQPLVYRSPVVPYVAAFYSHWFITSAYPDVDTLGTRGGVLYVSGRLIAGLGIVYEHVVSACSGDCDSVYPDITLGFTF